MAYIKITKNKNGKLVGRIHVSTKDINTDKNKVVARRFYNDQDLTEYKFEKYLEKKAIELEEELEEAYLNKKHNPNRILTFIQLAQEFVDNVNKNLSHNYYQRAKPVVKAFNKFLQEHNLDKLPINEIKVRDAQMFLNSFETYKKSKEPMVMLIQDLPKSVNLRQLARDNILNRNASFHMRKSQRTIPKRIAMLICEQNNLFYKQYFIDVNNEFQYSVETIKGYRRVLRTIFNEAIRYEWITKNPFSQTKISACSQNNTSLREISEKEIFSFQEAQAFLKALDEMDYDNIHKKVVLKFMLLTGVRTAEMCGLRWSDIDFDKKIVHIKRNRLQSTEIGAYEKSPKTKTSMRDIPLTDDLIKDLKEYYEWFKISDNEFEYNLDSYYLASNIYRKPIYNGTLNAWLKAFERKHGFKPVSSHGLRHTFCSLLLSQNVPIQTVSKYMGHSDSTITLKVYSHFIPDTQEKVINALNNLITN